MAYPKSINAQPSFIYIALRNVEERPAQKFAYYMDIPSAEKPEFVKLEGHTSLYLCDMDEKYISQKIRFILVSMLS